MKALKKKEMRLISVLIWGLVAIGAAALFFAGCSGGDTQIEYLPGEPIPGPPGEVIIQEVPGLRVIGMRVLRQPPYPSGQGGYAELAGSRIELTWQKGEEPSYTQIEDIDFSDFYSERLMTPRKLADDAGYKTIPIYHKKAAYGVSTSVMVPAILPLIRITVSGQINEVYEDDIDINPGTAQIIGEWETSQYLADWNTANSGAAAVGITGAVPLLPSSSSRALPFPTGFPSLVLDPAQQVVRLYGITADLANTVTIVDSGLDSIQGDSYNYLTLAVGKIWMVQGAALKAGTGPTRVWLETADGTSSGNRNPETWYTIMGNAGATLTVTYYDLREPRITTTRDITWVDYMRQVELYRLSMTNVVSPNPTASFQAGFYPDMSKFATGATATPSPVTILPAFRASGITQGADDNALVDGKPVAAFGGYLRPRTYFPGDRNVAMNIQYPIVATPGATAGTTVPNPSPTPAPVTGSTDRGANNGFLVGPPVFGDVRDPFGTAPRARFYYFGRLFNVPVNVSRLQGISWEKRGGTGRIAPLYRTGNNPVPAWSAAGTQVAVALALDREIQIKGDYRFGDAATSENMPRILNDAGAAFRLAVDSDSATNWYTLQLLDANGDVASDWNADILALTPGSTTTLTQSVRIIYNLQTATTSGAQAPVIAAPANPFPMKDNNTAKVTWTAGQGTPRMTGWSNILTTPIQRTITLTVSTQ